MQIMKLLGAAFLASALGLLAASGALAGPTLDKV